MVVPVGAAVLLVHLLLQLVALVFLDKVMQGEMVMRLPQIPLLAAVAEQVRLGKVAAKILLVQQMAVQALLLILRERLQLMLVAVVALFLILMVLQVVVVVLAAAAMVRVTVMAPVVMEPQTLAVAAQGVTIQTVLVELEVLALWWFVIPAQLNGLLVAQYLQAMVMSFIHLPHQEHYPQQPLQT
jgi:hypothetical protein